MIDLRRVKPLDEERILASARKTGHVICCEDGMYNNGVSARVAEVLLKNRVETSFSSVGVNDRPVPAGTRSQLLEREGMNAESIVKLSKEVLAR